MARIGWLTWPWRRSARKPAATELLERTSEIVDRLAARRTALMEHLDQIVAHQDAIDQQIRVAHHPGTPGDTAAGVPGVVPPRRRTQRLAG